MPCGEDDHILFNDLESAGCRCRRFASGDLIKPGEIRNQSGDPYRVFTPFYKAFLRSITVKEPLPVPGLAMVSSVSLLSLNLDDVGLKGHAFWAAGFNEYWEPGETGGIQRLKNMSESLRDYTNQRDIPAADGTSRMSPYLHFGDMSARSLWHAVGQLKLSLADRDAYRRQLVWREFAMQLMHEFPETIAEPMDARFKAFPWKDDPTAFRAWTKGQTGFPIVDAGMRQLWHTGWMHNRVRMIVGSFLVKDLRIPWQWGMDWFFDTLVDADLANNVMGWQWIAGCGADAAPYFRVFNPYLQSRKFDGSGTYIRRWVPELADLPDKWIHEPAAAPPGVLADAGITLGIDYPHPMVDHAEQRDLALQAYSEIKSTGSVNE
jgi:deoxyribodipyrimidine photo-lyase